MDKQTEIKKTTGASQSRSSKLLDGLAIWWTAQEDCIFEPYHRNYTRLPNYIWEQYCARYGRAGRGRLWVPADIGLEDIGITEYNPKWEDERKLINCGGIVFRRGSLLILRRFPGYITDFNLNAV